MIVSNRNYNVNGHPLVLCMCHQFLTSNDKAIGKNDKIHGRKLQNLIPNVPEKSIMDNVSHDADKIIYNFSNYHLTDSDKSSIRGLNFAIPPNKTELFKISTSI